MLTVPDKGEADNDLQSVLFQSTLDAIVAALAGTGVVSGCAVTQRAAGANMSVDVAAGSVAVAGAVATVSSGNVAIGAADGSNDRIDLVVANGSGTKSIIAGTAAASPKEPTLDTTTYVLLAAVRVPTSATTIPTAKITDRRVPVRNVQLARTAYNPGTQTTVSSTSGTYADIDATNLTVTFIAPFSGVVDVWLEAVASTSNNSTYVTWNLRDGSGDVAGTGGVALGANATNEMSRTRMRMRITGLTPGTSYTYKWGQARLAGAGNASIIYGGTTTSAVGAALMEVEGR